MKRLTLWKDPYGTGKNLWKKQTMSLKEGLTVLVGNNGIGKTTLINNIKDILKKKNINYLAFNNLIDGGNRAMDKALFHGNVSFAASLMCSSEGESIILNMSEKKAEIAKYIKENKDNQTEFWILFDAIDSGLSIDNIVAIKENIFESLIELVKTKFPDKQLYIIVSANSYEMCSGTECYDVYNGKYVKFSNYEEYREFIMNGLNRMKAEVMEEDTNNCIEERKI